VPGLFWAPEPEQIRIALHQGRRSVTIRLEPSAGQAVPFRFGCAGKCRGEHLVRVPTPDGSEHGPGHPQDVRAVATARPGQTTFTTYGESVPTINQLVRKGRQDKVTKTKTPALKGSPQRRGVCTRVLHHHPQEAELCPPQGARVRLTGGSRSRAYHPGGPVTTCRKHSIRARCVGGRVKDLPGVRYKIVRGLARHPGRQEPQAGT